MVEDRPVGVRPDLHRSRRLALVAERVHVADDRVGDLLVRLHEGVDRTDVGHLVDRRSQRDRRPGHRREAWAPHAAGDRHVLALDATLVGDDGAHGRPVARRLDLDVEHLRGREDLQGTLGDRLVADQGPAGERVDHRDARRVEAAQHHTVVEKRNELLDLGGRQQPSVDAPRRGRRHPPVELLHPLRRTGNLDAATRRVHVHRHVLPLALQRQQGHLLVVVGGEDEVGGVAGRSAGVRQGALVDLHEIGPTEPGEVADEAVADDPGADDDALRPLRQRPGSPLTPRPPVLPDWRPILAHTLQSTTQARLVGIWGRFVSGPDTNLPQMAV